MAAENADDAPSVSERLERFAEIVDAAGAGDGTDVVDTETNVHSGALFATLQLRIGEGPQEVTADDMTVTFEVAEGNTPDGVENLRGEYEDVDVGAEEIVDELEDGLEDDEPDAGDEQDEFEVGDEVDTTPDGPAGRVLEALREEGELAGPELKTVAEVGNVYNAISKLEYDDLIEKRDDPDDGRRTLYRPADWLVDEDDDQEDGPVWNGEDPETIVADSSLPARVVLDDILDAAESASTVIEVAEALDVDVDNLEPVCWQLTLKKPDSLEIVGGVDEQVETIREVAA